MAKYDKRSGQRATGHMTTADENSKINKKSNQRWRNRMCCSCFQRGVVIVDGNLYCKDCNPESREK